ncbi:MAG: FAD-dependent oxidoreductase [Oscillospiraceae bacterium]|nr:FAD-dependent oxidoreductase [Oscillospiraceae bacterium]
MVINTKEQLFWTSVNNVPAQYPWLTEDINCEIAIVGGGVTAALCALRFSEAGHDTVMVSQSPIGFGGTAASSGMMSIDGEQSISTLVEKIGADRAMMAIGLMSEAINNIETLCNGFEDNCGFKRMDSMRFADDAKTGEKLRHEYSVRLHNGIDVELLTNWSAAEHFTFPIEAGVYSRGIGAQIDPYRFVHAVTSAAVSKGVRVFENTAVNKINKEKDDFVKLDCDRERRVYAKYVIMAAGLSTERHCGGVDKTSSVCVVVTEPINNFSGWRGPCIIHSESCPGLFLTVTPDNRILIGGPTPSILEKSYVSRVLDLASVNEKKYEQLEKRLHQMFPAIRNITAEYVYTSRLARTEDGLPVLGRTPDDERIAYALCCGDDGLLYSEIAGRLLLEQYQGRSNQQLSLFSPGREWRIKH